MRSVAVATVLSLALAGCGSRAPTLPDDPIDKAASCGAIAAASERAAAGIKGDLSADAQGRILHYALLAGSSDGHADMTTVNTISQREPDVFDKVVKGKWETLNPACAAAFPATAIAKPALPDKERDAVRQCDALVGFLRKALGSAKGNFSEALTTYGVLADKLSNKAALTGKTSPDEADKALAAAARLGPPPAVIAACQAKFGS